MSVLGNELEAAFVSLIAGGIGAQANVYQGRASTNRALPNVTCIADGDGDEDPKMSGNYWFNVRIRVQASSATETDGVDPRPADVLLVNNVFSLLTVTNLDVLLNAQGRVLTVFPTGWIMGAQTAYWDDMGAWVDELPMRVYCCNSVLAA